MKRIFLLTLAVLLFLTGCATNRHKLSPQANVDLKTANVYYSQQNVDEALKYYNRVLQDNPDHALALGVWQISIYIMENRILISP